MRSGARWHPAAVVPLALLGAISVGTGALMLPGATAGEASAPLLVALFTATSSITTCGVAINDTATYWSTFGHVTIMILTQVGGFGIVTMATLLTLLISDQLGLRNRLLLGSESAGLSIGNAPWVLVRVAVISLVTEGVITLIVAGRLWFVYDYPLGDASWYGVFHAVQAFNNCGFGLYRDNIKEFVGDAWVSLPLTLGVIIGATGFPVLFELWSGWRRPRRWSVHTRLTVLGTLILLAAGFVVILVVEWTNPQTFGPLGVPTKLLASFVQTTVPRSGGYPSIDYSAMRDESFTVAIGLMFIGGGTASAAGGIKVTTFFLLAFVIAAELRGEPDVIIGRRRIAPSTQRLALAVALLGVAATALGTLIMLNFVTNVPYSWVIFEVTSAYSTTGLTTGIVPGLPTAGQVLLILLMFLGRVSSIAAASALVLNRRRRLYRYPEERPLVG